MTKPAVDYALMQQQYEAGVLTDRQIGEYHGVSHVAVHKRAKREGWERNLSGRIEGRARALIDREVSTRVNSMGISVNLKEYKAPRDKQTEREIIESNALVIAQVVSQHRKTAWDLMSLGQSMLLELATTQGIPEDLREALRAAAGDDQATQELLHRVLSLPGRVTTLQRLADSIGKAIQMQRQAFNLDDDRSKGSGGLEDRLKEAGAVQE